MAAAAPAATPMSTFAGIAWLLTAAGMGYLAFEQWSLAPLLGGEAAITALFNGAAAVITAYFGARCLQRPRRGSLRNASWWAALNVVWGAYQIANGVTYGLFFLILVGTAVAGILSFVAREQAPP